MRRSLGLVALLATALVTALPLAGQSPQFRVAVDLVHLDVSVLDRQRRPVRGLSASDFTVLEDGTPQTISTFVAVDYPDSAPVTAGWMRTVPPDTRRNDTLEERRLFVIVMDDATAQSDLAALRSAREAATAFVDRLGPNDLAAILFTGNTRHSQDYTSDRARLLRAIATFRSGFRDMGRLAGGPDTDEFHYQSTVDTVAAVSKALIALPQRRKTLVYVGQGIPFDPGVASAPTLIAPGQAMVVSAAVMQQRLWQRFQRALAEAQRANVNVYTLDICGLRVPPAVLAPDPDSPPNPPPKCVPGLEQQFLRGLAESTGGRAALDQNDLTPAVEQIFVENASYYLLGMQSNNLRREGKTRRLSVRVNRPDVDVRARSSYVEPDVRRDLKRAEAEEAAPLRTAISGLLPTGEVPLQMWAAPFPVAGRREARVAITLALRPTMESRETATSEVVDVSINAFTPEGKPRGQHAMEARIALRPGPGGDVAVELLSSIHLSPGRYQLRVGAFIRSTREGGSVYYDLDVPDFSKASPALSGLALSARPGLTAASTDATPWLPVPPTTARAFHRTDQLTAIARVSRKGRDAAPVAWRARVVDSNDAQVWTQAGVLDVAAFTNGLADLSVSVPILALSDGPHLLELTLPDAPASAPQQSVVRFTIRPR